MSSSQSYNSRPASPGDSDPAQGDASSSASPGQEDVDPASDTTGDPASDAAGGDERGVDERGIESVDGAIDEVYQQLRELARVYMSRQRPDHTLQATALTHEAYLRLRRRSAARWSNHAHFLGIAARAMRQVLVDHERTRLAEKRGAGARKLSLDEAASLSVTPQPDLLDLNRALDKLEASEPRKARVVELLYFGGLTAAEAAEVLGVTSRTVERDMRFARLWLYREMSGEGDGRTSS